MEISTVSPASNPPSQSTPPDPKSPPRRDLDFVNIYTMYADILELHPSAHAAVAVQLIAAALNGKVQIKYGGLELTLDLWMALLSRSGGGRNTLLKLISTTPARLALVCNAASVVSEAVLIAVSTGCSAYL